MRSPLGRERRRPAGFIRRHRQLPPSWKLRQGPDDIETLGRRLGASKLPKKELRPTLFGGLPRDFRPPLRRHAIGALSASPAAPFYRASTLLPRPTKLFGLGARGDPGDRGRRSYGGHYLSPAAAALDRCASSGLPYPQAGIAPTNPHRGFSILARRLRSSPPVGSCSHAARRRLSDPTFQPSIRLPGCDTRGHCRATST